MGPPSFFSTNFRKDSRASCLPFSMSVSYVSVAIFFLVFDLTFSFITLYFSNSSKISRNSSSVTLLSFKAFGDIRSYGIQLCRSYRFNLFVFLRFRRRLFYAILTYNTKKPCKECHSFYNYNCGYHVHR